MDQKNNLDYLLRRGVTLDDIERARENGVTVKELADLERSKEAQGQTLAEQPVKPPDFSDAGNAAVFTERHRDDLCFVDALGWLHWDGQRWKRDDHTPLAWALELSAEMLSEAKAENRQALAALAEATSRYDETGSSGDGEELTKAKNQAAVAKAYLSHAKALRGAVRLKNMIELSKPALHLAADKVDANPFDLNTPAGIVDLISGDIRPHDKGAYCSQMTAASPGNDGLDLWNLFLDQITGGDGGLQGFLQLVAGMAMIGAVYHEGIVIAWGSGRNGKSTLFNVLLRVLGDYGGTIDITTLTTDRQNRGAALASLRGNRLVIAGELEEHQRLSTATLKRIASTDMLTIEEKYKQPETVKQTHTLILFTNHLPRVGSTDDGTWRRLLVVPFKAQISQSAAVQNLADILVKESGGAVLSWAVEGAGMFFRNGCKLVIPDAVEEATDEYRQREDWVSNFVDEVCVRDPNGRARSNDLYQAYRTWAADRGEYVRRLNDFAAGMETAGFQKHKYNGIMIWSGITLQGLREYQHPARYAVNG